MANQTFQVKGRERMESMPKVASTAIAYGAILTSNGSGYLTNASASSTLIFGISRKAVVSTDADYASTTQLPFLAITGEGEYEVDVVTGTLTTAMIGNYYDLADSTGIDVTGTSHKQFLVTGFISATKARGKFVGAQYRDAS